MKKTLLHEDMNLETEDETVYTWKIENWRKMERRSHGPIFHCGGSPWFGRMQFLLPNGFVLRGV